MFLSSLYVNIILLTQRLNFGKTPQEIYDEIEMLISSDVENYNYDVIEESTAQENNDDLSDFEFSA